MSEVDIVCITTFCNDTQERYLREELGQGSSRPATPYSSCCRYLLGLACPMLAMPAATGTLADSAAVSRCEPPREGVFRLLQETQRGRKWRRRESPAETIVAGPVPRKACHKHPPSIVSSTLCLLTASAFLVLRLCLTTACCCR